MHERESKVDVSVVVALLNEESSLPELIERVGAATAPLGSYELILVDDGSSDNSWEIIEKAAKADERIVGIRLSRNFGQHPATTAGLEASRGDVVVTLDADLQNPPEEIPKLVARLGDDCDVASGWRQARNDSPSRTAPSRLMNAIIARVTGVRLNDYGCMMRAYKRDVIDMLALCPEVNRSITALVSWLGVSIVEVPIRHESRKHGRSRYNYWSLVKMSFDIVTGFSTGLLQFVSLLGVAVSVLGLGMAAVLIGWRIIHGVDPIGISTFLAVLLFLAGIQVAAIGIVGEYVGRVFRQVQGRPYYLVRTIVGNDGKGEKCPACE